jgi:hypothetical protein
MEFAVLLPLLVLIIALCILPGVLTNRMATSVNQVVSPSPATTSYEWRSAGTRTLQQIDNEHAPSIAGRA